MRPAIPAGVKPNPLVTATGFPLDERGRLAGTATLQVVGFSDAWLAGDNYSIADAAFTPYIVRLEHLDVMGLLDPTPRTAEWYRRIKARPSFEAAIVRWENAGYLDLMKRQGRENWPKIKEIMAAT